MTPGKCSAVVTLSMWDKCYYIITLENTIECILEGHDQDPLYEGLYVNMEPDDDEHDNYMFNVHGYEHDLYPNDRVMLGVHGRPQYQTGTVKQCSPTRLLIHTDWPLDISESYSIELIL